MGTATRGHTLAVWWPLTAAPVPGGALALDVIDPATGSVLVGGGQGGSSADFVSPGQFVVPSSGSFVVRVGVFFAGDVTTAPYEFFVAPVH
ncbi:MAG TPA: hypothetical protein VKB45_01210 [Gemmatimonadales bacterium]|nr:hypothetical protein [Gemmatimonadales bacterium]